ncbi:nucleolar RNA helicase 2 [Patella vulgata]|uniref:nucleolar RNA helicase 2 n=1 Tax=Patella vulgata TaxID=6465 RepID=UPI00217F56F4|nr:nucleolar RNA helicase 2 [Patella vulgata]
MKLTESTSDVKIKKDKSLKKKKKVQSEDEEEEVVVKKDKKEKKEKKDKPSKKEKAEKVESDTSKTDKKEKKEKSDKKDKKDKKSTEINGVNGKSKDSHQNGETISEEEELTPQQIAGAFTNFKISPITIKKLKAKGITYLFPVQTESFDIVYSGADIITQARTGTGKTLAFSLPIIEKLQLDKSPPKRGRLPKVIVMAPTRELAKQVSEDFQAYSTSLIVLCIYGGTPYGPQERVLRSGVDVIVGTPGRINDHIQKGNINLSEIKHVILDEVDNMLDMGFVEIVEEILGHAYRDGKCRFDILPTN